MINSFKLELNIEPTKYDPEYHVLNAKIFVDGNELSHEYVSLYDLIESLKGSGEYYIYNCSCGVSGCAKIVYGIKVKHAGNIIKWKTRIPVSYYGFKNFHQWLKTVKNSNFQFDKVEMIQTVKEECNKILDHVQDLKFDDFDDNSSFIFNGFGELENVRYYA